uniref:Uncharacterized protein n=1 Tax=Homalodisca liturata TaxID=320908 RepID=A0A1B6I8M4_9HEMI
MFDSDIQEAGDLTCEPKPKKKKLTKPQDSEVIHSSLGYSSFKVPPLVEYKSIDGYCETKPGISLSVSSDSAISAPSTSGLNNLQSISSPVVFKSPKTLAIKRVPHSSESKPFMFFSVEDLSLVKSLKHWTNTKVCPVGLVMYNCTDQQCYLHSVMEKGQWSILLDTSLLLEIPNLETLLQIFGTLEVVNGLSRVKVNFYRNLGSVDLPLFVESYKLMQKYVPDFVKTIECEKEANLDDSEFMETTSEIKLNDTLDDYSFSNIL